MLFALLLLALIPASQARGHLAAGRDQLEQARSALNDGDVEEADRLFASAQQEFIAASASARNPVFRLVTPIPVLGRTPDAVVAIADAGQAVAEAGSAVTGAVADLPGGLESLSLSRGRVPLGRIEQLSAGVGRAADLTKEALVSLEGSAGSLLLPPVADARTQTITLLGDLSRKLRDASDVLVGLPAFLGADGRRVYMFGAQNPAELRGTGGFIGAYSVMVADEGKLSFSPFTDIHAIPPPTSSEPIPPPSDDYARIYDQFGGAASWHNGNMTPDFPSAAQAMENNWKAAGGVKLDGVILADPYALAAMLKATGPVEAPSLGTTLTADNVVPFVTNEVYSRFSTAAERKSALGVATQAVIEAFLEGSTSPEASFAALRESLGGGHIQVYSNDPGLERAFANLSVGGALAPGWGDFIALVQNNGGANKIDFYLDRTVDYSVRLGAVGTASGTIGVHLENHAPLEGAPAYVLGPFPGVSRRSENVSFVSMYCSPFCSFTGKTSQGSVYPYGGDTERDLPFTWDYVRIRSGGDASIRYTTAVQDAWRGDQFGGTYRFTYLNQPTIRPTRLRFEVQVPDGMDITSTSVPMTVNGSSAIWEGTPGRTFELEVTFRPPPLARAWTFLWHVLTQPVVKL